MRKVVVTAPSQKAQLAYQDEPALSATLLRSLSDRVYEKRKTGALEIEARMRELVEKQDRGGKVAHVPD